MINEINFRQLFTKVEVEKERETHTHKNDEVDR